MKTTLLALALALTACGASPTHPTHAAQDPDDAPLPLWPAVRKGKLANGLTYYVMRHTAPLARASLRLVVNAGSLEEDDDQRGLAHFDEHMAFNGTKNFPKSALVDYLEKSGVRFGADLNAHTTMDETVYELEVPTDTGVLDKGLDILRDFAGNVTYDPAEVGKERGVVKEEWRTHRGVAQRLREKQWKVLFGGTRYLDRETIGLPEIIEHAPPDALVRFYRDWYRPDLMAVIAVGDFDVATVEEQIKARFSSLAPAHGHRKRPLGGAPPSTGLRVSIEADAELPSSAVVVSNLVARRPDRSRRDLRRHLAEMLYTSMLNQRLSTIARKPDAPFIAAAVGFQSMTREIDDFQRIALAKQGHTEDAMRGLLTEVARFERHGIVPDELERARVEVTRGISQLAETQETSSSRSMVGELIRNFLEGELVVGGLAERDLSLSMLPSISMAEIAKQAEPFQGDANRVVLVTGPERDKLPTEAGVVALLDEVRKTDLEPWKQGAARAVLMEKPPTPGTIVSEKKNDALGLTEWKLSNGVRVIVKPTTFEIDDVAMMGFSAGGLGMVPDTDYRNGAVADDLAMLGGVSTLDAEELARTLAGKQVRVSASVSELSQDLMASGSVRDLEPMMQLAYLRMTAPRKDERAFTTWRQNAREMLVNRERSPEARFGIAAQKLVWNGNLRHTPMTPAELDQLDLDKALAIYRDRFSDASGFTFVIVGAVKLDALRPLVTTYLASLPAHGRKETERDLGDRRVGGIVEQTFAMGTEPKAHVSIELHREEAWTRDGARDLAILDEVLDMELRSTLREDLGGVYGVQVGHDFMRSPHGGFRLSISFTCDPSRVAELEKAVYARLDKLAADGPTRDEVDKVRATYARSEEVAQHQNMSWLMRLASAYRFGDDPKVAFDFGRLGRMKPELVKAAAQHFLDYKKQHIQLVLVPEAAKRE